ncbi:alkaline phosphatase [Schumannella sp. 10F1B-5-1]|nr:alkaline phosphatase [Schumannella sp. 10F1B-5-1]
MRRRRTAALAGAGALILTAAALPAVAATEGVGLDAFGGAFRNSDDKVAQVQSAIQDRTAKNVILLIGDGMGDSEITVARNYAYGAAGTLPGLDALPLTGSYTTYSLYKDGPYAGKPDYVPDSAATGTAWATGTKTYDNAIGVDIHGAAHDNLIEIARANGLRTGNVSTAEIQDATPAVQAAHVAARSCYAPDTATCGGDLLQNGGRGSISEQLLDTRADLTLGGGSTSFDKSAVAGPWAGQTLFSQATTRGYQVVRDANALASVKKVDQSQPLLGLFTPGNFPTRYLPTTATVGGADQAPITCTDNPQRLDTRLSLASMTNTSLGLLNKNNGKGFFLQVEGASIDKQDHAADACGQIGETIDFDEAVQAALAFAKKDGNTLVIATADHAHTSQIVDSTPPGLSIALTTKDGAPMKVSYGTSAAGGSQQHTGTQVRIAAYGPGAAKVVGLTDQTDNFQTIAGSLGLNRDLPSFSARAFGTAKNSPKAGSTAKVALSGFGGDRQVTAKIDGTEVVIPKTDVIGGDATLSFTAPAKGSYTVEITGTQSQKVVKVALTVR